MKNWAQKENEYEERSSCGTIARDLWKYIPQKLYEAVDDCVIDSDGYWIWLKKGYLAYDHGSDCGIIHEYRISDLRDAIKTIKKTEAR